MPQFDPQLIQDMRNALEEVMTKVPLEYSTSATKAYLAECILKAAAQGHTSYNELVVAAADQIQVSYRCSPKEAETIDILLISGRGRFCCRSWLMVFCRDSPGR